MARKPSRTRKKRASGKKKSRSSSSKRRPVRKRSASPTKQTWEKFLQNKESKKILQEAWEHKNPEKHFGQAVKKLHRKYSKSK